MDTLAVWFAIWFPWMHLLLLIFLAALVVLIRRLWRLKASCSRGPADESLGAPRPGKTAGRAKRRWLLPVLAALALLVGLLGFVFGWGGLLYEPPPLNADGMRPLGSTHALILGMLINGAATAAFCAAAHVLLRWLERRCERTLLGRRE